MKNILIAVSSIALALPLAAQQTTNASTLFHEGLMLERAQGQVAQAIVVFERVIAEFPTDAVAPQVIAHLAEVYEAQNDTQASRLWARLTADYPSSPYAATARLKLAEGQAQSAGPFPGRSLDAMSDADLWSFSPDARTVAHVRGESPAQELWLRDLDTGRERKALSGQGRDFGFPQWSPDSRRFAYVTRGPKVGHTAQDSPHDVRVFSLAEAETRTVATADAGRSFVNWSPDGHWLVVQVGAVPAAMPPAGEIRLIDAATGASKRIGGAAPPTDWFAWTADSRQLVYEISRKDAAGMNEDAFFVASVDGGDVKPWSPSFDLSRGRINLASGVTHRATPDGRVLIRQVGGRGAGNSFYLTPITGGPPEPTCTSLAPIQCAPAMTPDGRFRVATDSGTKRILLFDRTKPGTPIRITTGFAEEKSPTLSPDGRLLWFASNPDGVWAMYVMPVDRAPIATPLRMFTLGSADVSAETWASSGRAIVDLSYEDDDIYRVTMDKTGHSSGTAGRLTQDSPGNSVPTVSPDSKSVAYFCDKGIRVMTADGAGERPVLPVVTSGHLEWQSADRVIFQRPSTTSTGTSLFSLNVNTGGAQPLTDLPTSASFWQFVPARNEIFFATTEGTNGTFTLRARNIASNTDRLVATIQDMVSFRFVFRVSPDAKQIAYGKWVGPVETRHPELHLMTIDGQNDRVLPASTEPSKGWRPSGYPYDWSPDGRFLLFDEFPGQLKVMEIASGQSWPIPQAIDDNNSEWSGGQWSPDGSFIVLERNGYRDEWRLFDGLTYANVVKLLDRKK